MTVRIITGDCRQVLPTLPDESVHCVVTSPPYFGLRDYGVDGQMGLETTPEQFIAGMVEVFRGVRRVLRSDGTLWLNLGDSYATSGRGGNPTHASSTLTGGLDSQVASIVSRTRATPAGYKQKDLLGIPWRVAFALQEDGWYLRQDIVWSKPNPMPESVTDRCTKAHEYLFLLSKSPRYYFDAEAIAEPVTDSTVARLAQDVDAQAASLRVPGKTNGPMKAVGRSRRDTFKREGSKREAPIPSQSKGTHRPDREESEYRLDVRNRRSVWTVATKPFKDAHFATFPPDLIRPCILAGCPPRGSVLDPFGGAGTTGLVADQEQRDAILIELNPAYAEMAERRIHSAAPLLAEVRA